MSALAAIIGRGPSSQATPRVERMLRAMAAVGGSERWVSESPLGSSEATVTLGASAHPWELAWRPLAMATSGAVSVAADTTLFHRNDLRRALGRPEDGTANDAALILAAYAHWGTAGIAKLEGEFAFVLYDRDRRLVIAARDFAGLRPLVFAPLGESLLIASRTEGLLSDPGVPRALDLASLTTVAAGLWSHSPQTVFRAIKELPAGHLLVAELDTNGGLRATPRVEAFWSPPPRVETRRLPLGPAAEELRALLVSAVRERVAPDGPTAISLSGGWDSSAVGSAATLVLSGTDRARLRPVSISYPPGDPGREDEIIETVTTAWGVTPAWIPVDEIRLLGGTTGDPVAEAAARALPFAHSYEHWNRALSRRARAAGARVILDGVGGDQLFQISDIYLADLFARGQWIELATQWRARGGRSLRDLWQWAVRPALPDALNHGIARLRGAPAAPDYLTRRPPLWFRAKFLAQHDVMARELAARPVAPRGDRVLIETHAFLRFAFFTRVVALLRGYALEEGVALRSPLLDDRVVRFAAQRPWSERADRKETKILLRKAMEGLIPPQVIAPRTHRTGITSAYFLRQLRGPARPVLESLLKDPVLASIGMIDPVRLRRAWEHVLAHDDDETGARVFFTLQTELWLRSRTDLLPQST